MSIGDRLRLGSRALVDARSTAVFRIGFGVAGTLLVARFFAHGWIDSLFIDPAYHFAYPGFSWVGVWPGWGMYAHFAVLGLAGLGIALGIRTRVCAAVFMLGMAYVELIDRTLYLNHYYWMVLTAGVLVLIPSDRAYAVLPDRSVGGPVVPMGVVWLLRFQVGMVYFFAGLAKVNGDWLLRGEPLATWLPPRSYLPLIGPLLAVPATAIAMSWMSALFDLTVVFWLSWRRTRLVAYGAAIVFHTLTWLLFPSIGLFPLLMTGSALIFFDPAWPARFVGAPAVRPAVAAGQPGRAVKVLTAVYLLAMVAIPLRHYVIPGDVRWTGEGYLGSWQVMLTERSGSALFVVTDPATGHRWKVPPPAELTPRQAAVMATDPALIAQTARLVASDLGDVRVGADVALSVNGRPSVQFTDPEVDLTGTEPSVRTWVLATEG